MFERLLSLFHTDRAVTTLPQADAQHALGALLVRAAKIDRAYLFEEVEEIDHVLAHLYTLNPVAAAKMRARCELLEESMPETETLARVLHDAIPMDDREAAVSALWSIVFADGTERPEEDDLLHQIEEILGVAPDRALALHDAALAAAAHH